MHIHSCLRRVSVLGAAVAFAIAPPVHAQQQQDNVRITGRVLDASEHTPIPTAAVLVTGTTIGQNTSDSGTFNFRLPADARTFTIRRIGYLSQTVPVVAGKVDYTVTLQRDILRLDAQVVTGVATTVASQNAANAVAVISAASVNEVPAPTIENSLEGKVPGAIIESNNGGAPGGGLEIQVRGITSIYGNAEPLYVIDGVVVNNQTVDAGENAINRSGGGLSATGQAAGGAPSTQDNGVNRIADLNPADIENIEILKGASASAIYGSKASAGVIIITTRKGQSGKAKWDVSGQVGQYASANNYPMRQFPTLASAQAWYNNDIRGLYDKNLGRDTGAALIAADNTFISSIYSPHDYQSELFGNGQASYQGNVSVSGTLNQTQYYLSGLSKFDNGTMLNTGYTKQSMRTTITQQFASALSITAGANYIHDLTQRGISGNDNIGISPYDVFSYTPEFMNLDHRNAAGVWATNPFGPANPFADAMEIATPQEVSRFIGSGSLNWTPWKTEHQTLQFNAVGGADLTSYHALLYAPPTLQVEQEIATGLPGTSVSNDATIDYYNYSLSLVHHYTGFSWLDATTAVGFVRERRSLNNPVSIGYATLAGVNAPTVGAVQNNFFYATAQKDQSLYGQEQILTLDSRLSVTAGVTAERSTLDGNIGKFYAYPHYAASYRIPQFVGFLNEFKVRAAYGQSGNLGNYGVKYTPYNPVLIDGRESVDLPNTLGDSTLKPESEQEIEVGFDATMFKSRAQFSATVYQKRLTSLLLQAGVTPSYGFSNIWLNGGEFTNQGIELALTSTPLQMRNGLTWVNTLSFSRNYSVVNALPVPAFIPINTNFGYGADLITPGRSVSEIANTLQPGSSGINPQTGDFSAGYLISMSNEFTWHNFRVFGMLDWSRGGNTINLTDNYFDTGPQLGTDSVAAVNRLNAFNGGAESYVQTATFFKVREVAISWALPASLVNRYGFSRITSARLSLNGYNLWAIFHYHGLDPEVSAFGNQAVGRGYDVTPYPPARSFFLGIDLGL